MVYVQHVVVWLVLASGMMAAAGNKGSSSTTEPVAPVVTWASHPVQPGQVLLLQGSFPQSSCDVLFTPLSAPGKTVTATPRQQTTISLKVRDMQTAVCALRVKPCSVWETAGMHMHLLIPLLHNTHICLHAHVLPLALAHARTACNLEYRLH
jgi:hypothetical protein